jgi:hypothetical protein
VKGYIPEVPYNDSCINAPLDALYDSSANSNGLTNCNTYEGSTSQLGFLVTPFGGGGGLSSCISSNLTYASNGNPSGSFSSCTGGYAKPSWQTGLTPGDNVRDLPDIAIFAGDGTFQNFYLYCEQDVNGSACSLTAGSSSSPYPDIQGIGGTSVSAEVFAGMMALLNQAQGSPVGLPNENLYALAAQPWANCQSSGTLNSGCIFYQVTSGSIAMPCVNPTTPQFGTAPGCTVPSGDTIGETEVGGTSAYSANSNGSYSYATGLGSLNVYNLVKEWSVGSGGASDFVISASPTAVNVSAPGGSGTTQVSIEAVNGFNDTVNLSCASASLPSGVTCSFGTSPLSAGGMTILTINTTTSAGAPPSANPDTFGSWRIPGSQALGCLLALAILWVGLHTRNPRWGLSLAGGVFLVFLGIAGCGSNSSSNNKTPQVATPTFAPAAGTYSSTQTVAISDTTSGATIYYTTNGSAPTTSSTPYTGPITVGSTEAIEAIAAATGMTNSALATAMYTIQQTQVATPTFSPTAGTYNSSQTVTISDATSGATIYYTTDGTTPTTSSAKYSGPIAVSSTETIEAIATASGLTNSAVGMAMYTVTGPPIPATAITITGTSTAGMVSHSTTITLTVQ